MKNFLFDENYLFEKPFFINKFINGSGYKNLQLRIEERQNTTYFIKLNSLKEYFYKNKTMLIFSSTLKEVLMMKILILFSIKKTITKLKLNFIY